MPFTILNGTMGGGKSYYAAELALKCWNEGGIVHSNMDWEPAELEARGFDKLHVRLPDDPSEWKPVLKGGEEDAENLLIVDEAAMIFHVWDAASNKNRDRELFDVLVMSRKLGLDVYFISQSAENVAAPLRRMANFQVRCVAVKRIPFIGPAWAKIRGDFLRILKSGESGKELSRSYGRYSPEIGTLYMTEALRGAAATIDRHATRQRQKLKSPLWLKVLTLACFLAVPLGFWQSYRALYGSRSIDKTAQEQPGKPGQGIAHGIGKVAAAAIVGPGQGSSLPRLHPFSEPSGRSSDWVEWQPQDERIICATYKGPQGLTYYLLGGEVVKLGAWIDGEAILRLIPQGPEAFAITSTGRTFYLRKMTYAERRERDQHILEQAAQRALSPAAPAAIPSALPPSIASQP